MISSSSFHWLFALGGTAQSARSGAQASISLGTDPISWGAVLAEIVLIVVTINSLRAAEHPILAVLKYATQELQGAFTWTHRQTAS